MRTDKESLREVGAEITSPPQSAPKVSVIVPVYKVEKYLPECIESILAQTFTDFELILVDDGSPDNSGKICDDYATRDSRIRVFHKENGGVTSARRLGVERSRGEWVMFVDSDDCLSKEALAFLNDSITDDSTDIVEGEMSLFCHDIDASANSTSKKILTISAENYARELGKNTWIVAPFAKIYRKQILTPWVMNTPKFFDMGEDILMNVRVATRGMRFATKIPIPLYFYRQWEASASRRLKKNERYWMVFIEEIREILFKTAWKNKNEILAWHAFRILKILIARGGSINRNFWLTYTNSISSLRFGIFPMIVRVLLRIGCEGLLKHIRCVLNQFRK